MNEAYDIKSSDFLSILKEATHLRGWDAQYSSIIAAKIVAECIKSTFGPEGMDKMIIDRNGFVTLTNDGATILNELEVQHPAAKILVEAAKTQDKEVGDGTTATVILAAELLSKAENLLHKGIHPTLIIDGYSKAAEKAIKILHKIAIPINRNDRSILRKIAATAMMSKLLAENRNLFADLVVDAVLHVLRKVGSKHRIDVDNIKIKKKTGGFLTQTKLVKGVILDKEIPHIEMPKRIENAKIAIFKCPVEIEKTEFDTEINIMDLKQIKLFQDEETSIINNLVKKIVDVNANVVVCEKGIDDLALYHLAKKGILAFKWVSTSDVEKISKATSGKIITNLADMTEKDVGFAKIVEERRIGDDRIIFLEGCKNPLAVTILIRGGASEIVEEAERSIHDAIFVVKDAVEEPKITLGGGASEAEVVKELRIYANKVGGKEQLSIISFAEALEALPMTLTYNAGFDPIATIVKLRAAHKKGEVWHGIDLTTGEIRDMQELDVYEPLIMKVQIIKTASEATSMILKIDDIIAEEMREEKKEV